MVLEVFFAAFAAAATLASASAVHDETSLPQTSTGVKSGITAGYEESRSWEQELTVYLSCGHDSPLGSGTYHASEPVALDKNRVSYAIDDFLDESVTDKYFLQFPQGQLGESLWEDELSASTALPSRSPKSWKCTGEVMQAGKFDADESLMMKTLGGSNYTYSVLVEEFVVGFPVDSVLMTLASPKDPFLLKFETPKSCDLGKFDQATYNAVQTAFAPEKDQKEAFESIQVGLVGQLKCLFAQLQKTCKQTGFAWTELKPSDLIYGKEEDATEARLMLNNVGNIKKWTGKDKEDCETKFTDVANKKQEWPNQACQGPHWPTFFVGDFTKDWYDDSCKAQAAKDSASSSPAEHSDHESDSSSPLESKPSDSDAASPDEDPSSKQDAASPGKVVDGVVDGGGLDSEPDDSSPGAVDIPAQDV